MMGIVGGCASALLDAINMNAKQAQVLQPE
jgi:hypothetical protein